MRKPPQPICPALLLILLLAFIASGCSGGTANDTTALPTAIVMTQPPPTTVTRPTIPPATPSVAPSIPPATTRPTNPPTAGKPLRLDNLEFGVVSHLYYTDRERVLTLTNIAGFDWVRQQIQWKDIEGPPNDYKWGELDNIVNEVVARKLKLLISITKAPSFYNETNGLPNDPKAMGNFVEALVKRYGNKITAIEIWNEQNLATENGGRVTVDDAGKYVEILVESYNRIKAVAPEIYVLAGAPSSSGVNQPELAVSDENYFKAMYTYKDGLIKDHFDAQAVHPGGAANSPDWLYPEEPGDAEGWNDHPTHYFRHIENVRQFMVENGVGDRQIWITEFGWATPNDTPGYEFGNQVSLEKQADYVVSAVNRTYKEYRDDQGQPWVGVMFLWNMNFAVLWGAQGNPDHEQASFGILGPDWSPRPAFTALQGLLPQIKQDQGR